MKRLKTILSLTLAMLFISAMSFTSCGGKKEVKNENEAEQVEDAEHPTETPAVDSAEHPEKKDSAEHPAGN